MGGKHVSDLLGDNVYLTTSGNHMKISGEVKTIKDPWEEFDAGGNNTGHFVPIQIPSKYWNEDITVTGRAGGDRVIQVNSEDPLLIQRLENLSGLTSTLQVDGETIIEIDYSGLVPTGEAAYDAEKEDFGGFGHFADYAEGIAIEWNGTKGTVTGRLKWFKGETEKNTTPGNYFPLSLSEWYDNVNKTVACKSTKVAKDKDWIMHITEPATPIKVTYQGMLVMELDLSAVTLTPAEEP